MLRLVLRIVLVWTAFSLLCVALWALLLLVTRRFFGGAKAEKYHRKTTI